MKAKIYQIYYLDSQKKHIFSISEPVFNEKCTVFFENSVIKKVVNDDVDSDYIGVLSWKFGIKKKYDLCNIKNDLSGCDVYSFFPRMSHSGKRYMQQFEYWHPGAKNYMKNLLKAINKPVTVDHVREPILFNYFIAKKSIYTDYVNNWLGPAMKYMTEKPPIGVKKNNSLSRYKDYPNEPFLLERLFSLYLTYYRNLTVKHLRP